jgi:hypothetical protein
MPESILRRILCQLPLPLGRRTLRPRYRSILSDRQLLDRFAFLLLLLLLFLFLLRLDHP